MANLRDVKDRQIFVISGLVMYRALRSCPESYTVTVRILGRVIDGNPEIYPSMTITFLSWFGGMADQVEIVSEEQLMAWRLAGYDL